MSDQELPAGLTIKGRVVHIAHTAAYKPSGWFLHDNCDDESAYVDRSGNWSGMPAYLPTPAEAVEFACLHADLPKVDGRQPNIVRESDGYRVYSAGLIFYLVRSGKWSGMDPEHVLHLWPTAREAYLAVQEAASRRRDEPNVEALGAWESYD